ncbi:DUF6894 family protein [Methylobacterium sp. A54F]|jgi:hypothetical protein
MAIRFFFDLVKGSETLRDEEGVMVPTVPIVIRLVQESIRGRQLAGRLTDVEAGWTLRIRDDRNIIWRHIRIS